MKVTANMGGAGAVDPKAGTASGTVDGNGKATVTTPAKAPGSPAERPAWLPEGYDTPESFRAAWDKHGAPAAKAAADATSAANAAKVESVESKVDIPALEAEWAENNGELSEKTLKELEAKGITGEMVSEYIEGRMSKVSNYERSLSEHVGGNDNLKTLLDWAAKHYTDEQVKRFNGAVGNMKDPDGAKEALDVLLARYEKANGRSAPSVTAKSEVNTPAGVTPISDMKELVSLQSDPRYKKGDTKFINEVKARIAASPNLFKR